MKDTDYYTEDFVQTLSTKSHYFPPSSLVINNLQFFMDSAQNKPHMDNQEYTVYCSLPIHKF